MIKIECPDDLCIFQNKPQISPVIVRYITDYLRFFLEEYHCPDMREFGAFFCWKTKKIAFAMPKWDCPCHWNNRLQSSPISCTFTIFING